jgi:hypothetical protein
VTHGFLSDGKTLPGDVEGAIGAAADFALRASFDLFPGPKVRPSIC